VETRSRHERLFSVDANTIYAYTNFDSPGEFLPAATSAQVQRLDTFTDYQQFKPTGNHSIWVTIFKLNWFWQGEAVIYGVGSSWKLGSSPPNTPSVNPTGAPYSIFPTWSETLYNALQPPSLGSTHCTP